MKEFNYDIIKKNVDILVKNRDMTQTDLAGVLGMSQSNVSKALSEKDKKYFTLEQIYSIAEYFNVSLDWLTGRNVSNEIDISEKSIARFMAVLLSKKIIKVGSPNIVETVYGPNPNEGGVPAYTPYDEPLSKEIFYFPNQLDPNDYNSSTEEYEKAINEFESCGNDAPGKAVNRFLEKYLPVLRIYHSNNLNDEAFQFVLDGYLKDL